MRGQDVIDVGGHDDALRATDHAEVTVTLKHSGTQGLPLTGTCALGRLRPRRGLPPTGVASAPLARRHDHSATLDPTVLRCTARHIAISPQTAWPHVSAANAES